MNSPEIRHELRTPVNLIIGYCEILLSPEKSGRKPLPYPYREEVEGIYRNAQILQDLIETLFQSPLSPQPQAEVQATYPSIEKGDSPNTTDTSRPLILLDKEGTAIEALSSSYHFASSSPLIALKSIEEIGQLDKSIRPAAVVVNNSDSYDVPVISQLVGKQVPIVVFDVPPSTQARRLHGAQDYLMKPIQFEALAAALHRLSPTLVSVLIIDDNPDNASMITHMVQSIPERPQVWNAYSGREAMAILREGARPDLIILDFVLPDMNGLMLLDYLKAEDSTAKIPVLLVSAHRLQDVLEPITMMRLTLYELGGIRLAQLRERIDSLAIARR